MKFLKIIFTFFLLLCLSSDILHAAKHNKDNKTYKKTTKTSATSKTQKKVSEQYNITVGAGLVFQKFTYYDDFRQNTGLFDKNDKIRYLWGGQAYCEYLLNNALLLNLSFYLTGGYKFQYLIGGNKYNAYSNDIKVGELENLIKIMNHIVYANASYPIDKQGFWCIGITVGAGLSNYNASFKWKSESDGSADIQEDYNESSYGVICPAGLFVDYKIYGVGGRLGGNYIFSFYDKIEESRPKSDGYQIYIDIRYGF